MLPNLLLETLDSLSLLGLKSLKVLNLDQATTRQHLLSFLLVLYRKLSLQSFPLYRILTMRLYGAVFAHTRIYIYTRFALVDPVSFQGGTAKSKPNLLKQLYTKFLQQAPQLLFFPQLFFLIAPFPEETRGKSFFP